MSNQTSLIQPEQIEQVILLIRGQRVMLDRDLAALYGVTTGNLNKAVQRNAERFPPDFMFHPTTDEAEALRFQFGSLKRGQHFKYLPQTDDAPDKGSMAQSHYINRLPTNSEREDAVGGGVKP